MTHSRSLRRPSGNVLKMANQKPVEAVVGTVVPHSGLLVWAEE